MVNIKYFIKCVYIISVFVDLYNGYIQQFSTSETILPVLFKGGIILYSLKYILRNNHVAYFILYCTIAYLISLLYWLANGYANLNIELFRYITKLLYPFSVLLVLQANRNTINRDMLLLNIMYYGVIAAVSILLVDLLGLSVNTYGSNYGYGVKGFFKAGNDISLALILCNCISAYYLSVRNEYKYILCNIIITIACMRIGSTAALFGSIFITLILLLQPLYIKNKFSKTYHRYKYIILLFGIPVLVYCIHLIINTDSYTVNKFNINNILEGEARSKLRNAFYEVSKKFTISDYMFGIGNEELFRRIGLNLFHTNEAKSIEIDYLDMIGGYGLFLGGSILIYPLKYLWKYSFRTIYYKDLFSFWMTIIVLLFILHGILAGHAYTSIMAMTVLVGILFLSEQK